jgi:hypothetical protein
MTVPGHTSTSGALRVAERERKCFGRQGCVGHHTGPLSSRFVEMLRLKWLPPSQPKAVALAQIPSTAKNALLSISSLRRRSSVAAK